jgi:hypothetical protein
MASNKFNLKKEDFISTEEYRKEYIRQHHQSKKTDQDYNKRRKDYNK